MKRLISFLFALALTLSLTVPAFAAELSFSDVSEEHWAYDAITAMVEKELFTGTTKPVNGVAKFDPDAPMTTAAFLMTVVRYLYPEELAELEALDPNVSWYDRAWNLAYVGCLVSDRDFSLDEVNAPMTRQQMAAVLVRTCELLGEEQCFLDDVSQIPDYEQISPYLLSSVSTSYSKGLITGIDEQGTFDPLGTMTRAQAAVVLHRLVDPTVRKPFATKG